MRLTFEEFNFIKKWLNIINLQPDAATPHRQEISLILPPIYYMYWIDATCKSIGLTFGSGLREI